MLSIDSLDLHWTQTPRRRVWQILFILVCAVLVGQWCVSLAIVVANGGIAFPYIFDDALFFPRYAKVFLATGSFAFNVGEPPTYGNTSQLFQLAVTLLYWLFGGNAAFTVVLLSSLGQCAALAAIIFAYLTLSKSQSALIRAIVTLTILAHLSLSVSFFRIGVSGMETGWATAAVAMAARAIILLAREPARYSALSVGLWAPLAYAIRPDIAPLIIAPLVLMSIVGGTERRKAARKALVAALMGTGVLLAVLFAYYRDVLPLAVFIKVKPATVLVDTAPVIVIGYHYFYVFLRSMGSLFILAPFGLFRLLRSRHVDAVPIWGLWLSALAFVLTHCLLIVPIMGIWGRFYFPALLPLALPALFLFEDVLASIIEQPRRLRSLALTAMLASMFAWPAASRIPLVFSYHVMAQAPESFRSTSVFATASLGRGFLSLQKWYPLEVLDVMNRNAQCSVAASEHGWLSVLVPDTHIIDLSGLHDRHMVQEGFSADRLLGVQRPDILIYPHYHYRSWIIEIDAHPLLARDYETLGAAQGFNTRIAVRADSPCAKPIQDIYARYRR